jgi:hypothetical protein
MARDRCVFLSAKRCWARTAKPNDELFERTYTEDPGLYFSSVVQPAKVLKVEVGEACAFDNKPRPRQEALRKLEERAGTDARKLFEAFLKKIDKLEAAVLQAKERPEIAHRWRTTQKSPDHLEANVSAGELSGRPTSAPFTPVASAVAHRITIRASIKNQCKRPGVVSQGWGVAKVGCKNSNLLLSNTRHLLPSLVAPSRR